MSNNDVVMIELDRSRELRYGHKALKTLSALTGKSITEIETTAFDDFESIEMLVYCGLLRDAKERGETLQLEQMEDLLDNAPYYGHIVERVQQALAAAFPAPSEGNQPVPAEKPAKDTTGKKASE